MVRPSAFAVFRLMINSYRDACSTGRSVAFPPFRMRRAYAPAMRYCAMMLLP